MYDNIERANTLCHQVHTHSRMHTHSHTWEDFHTWEISRRHSIYREINIGCSAIILHSYIDTIAFNISLDACDQNVRMQICVNSLTSRLCCSHSPCFGSPRITLTAALNRCSIGVSIFCVDGSAIGSLTAHMWNASHGRSNGWRCVCVICPQILMALTFATTRHGQGECRKVLSHDNDWNSNSDISDDVCIYDVPVANDINSSNLFICGRTARNDGTSSRKALNKTTRTICIRDDYKFCPFFAIRVMRPSNALNCSCSMTSGVRLSMLMIDWSYGWWMCSMV